jgi:O-antigen ligase
MAIVLNMNYKKIVIFVTLISFYFGNFNINVGFAIKPFMIICFTLFIFLFNRFEIHKLNKFELMFIIFYGYFISTGLFAKYSYASLRLIGGILIVFFSYFILRFLLSKISISEIENMLSQIGIVFNILSLLFYFIGIVKLGFNFSGNGIKLWGVMLDRQFPRLIGILNDPNIFVYFNLIFFFYYLTNLSSKRNVFGFFLTSVTILLTVSRGAILGVVIGTLTSILISRKREVLKLTFFVSITIIVGVIIADKFINLDIIGLIQDRFDAIKTDGGSGRIKLWSYGIEFYLNNPLFGIGIFNFRPYLFEYTGIDGYLHSTFMDALVEGGLIGFSLFLLANLILIINLYRLVKLNYRARYLLLIAIASLVIMNSLSLIINEVYFLFLAICWRYQLEVYKNKKLLGTVI